MVATPEQRSVSIEDVSTAIVEAFNNGNPNRIDGVFADDFVGHLTGGDRINGPAAYKERIRAIRRAFPDFHMDETFLVADGDRGAVQYRWTGTHEGEYIGVPATEKRVATTSVALLRIEDGALAEMWAYGDTDTLRHQLEDTE